MIDPIFPQAPINSKQGHRTRQILVGKAGEFGEVVIFAGSTRQSISSQPTIIRQSLPRTNSTPTFAARLNQPLLSKGKSIVNAAEQLAIIPQANKQPGAFSLLKQLPIKFRRKSASNQTWATAPKHYYRQQESDVFDNYGAKNDSDTTANYFNSSDSQVKIDGISKKHYYGVWQPVVKFTLTTIMAVAIFVSAVIILPEVYYTVFSSSSMSSVEEVASVAAQNAKFDQQPQEIQPYSPAYNPDLPQGAWVNIPRIGVYSELIASANPQQALDQGTWLVPDFGRPGDYSQPTIIAAHRFGWDWWWQSDYWKYNSFYLLTETEPGDRVEVIYNQRQWTYEIYAAEEGEQITDYSADLILYTCKYLNSPVRYFRYARVVEV